MNASDVKAVRELRKIFTDRLYNGMNPPGTVYDEDVLPYLHVLAIGLLLEQNDLLGSIVDRLEEIRDVTRG